MPSLKLDLHGPIGGVATNQQHRKAVIEYLFRQPLYGYRLGLKVVVHVTLRKP